MGVLRIGCEAMALAGQPGAEKSPDLRLLTRKGVIRSGPAERVESDRDQASKGLLARWERDARNGTCRWPLIYGKYGHRERVL